MSPFLVTALFVASACALPMPAQYEDAPEGAPQRRWVEDLSKVFQNTIQPTKSPEKAPTGPQVFDFKFGYDLLQNLIAKMLLPKPLVDSIDEKDKYGNDGSKNTVLGAAVVRGSEALSKMINAAFEVPKLAAKMVSNSITQALNGLGAKLIGL